MNKVPKAAGLTVLFLLIALVSGCGGGDGGSTTASATAPKDSRRKEKFRWEWHATIACKRGMESADVAMHEAAGQAVPATPSAAPEWERFKVPVRVLLPSFRQTVHQLEKVEPARQDVYDYEQLLERFRRDLKAAEKHPGAPAGSRPLASAGKAAYVYGIHACLF